MKKYTIKELKAMTRTELQDLESECYDVDSEGCIISYENAHTNLHNIESILEFGEH